MSLHQERQELARRRWIALRFLNAAQREALEIVSRTRQAPMKRCRRPGWQWDDRPSLPSQAFDECVGVFPDHRGFAGAIVANDRAGRDRDGELLREVAQV